MGGLLFGGWKSVHTQAAGEAVDKMLTQDAFGVQQLHAGNCPVGVEMEILW
jgi:hypothetical protein